MSLDSAQSRELDHGAWMQPGVYPVADGVWRIPLPLPMAGLSWVNAWLFKDGDDVVLIDPGWATPESEAVLGRALESLETGFADVREILATHAHADHYSEALLLRRRFGTPVALGEGERPSLEAHQARREATGSFSLRGSRLVASGAGVLAHTIGQLQPRPYEANLPFETPSSWLHHEQRITLGDRELVAYATPGHTRGHMVISDASRGLLVTGDHVLPRITPSIGLEIRPEAFPLKSFLGSLAFVRSLPDSVMLPAHGNVTDSVHRRVDELLAHHEERFDAVAQQLRGGPDTAMAIASRLKWTRREHRLEDLEPVQQMSAVLEIAAHLDVLSQRGRVRRNLVGELELFEAT